MLPNGGATIIGNPHAKHDCLHAALRDAGFYDDHRIVAHAVFREVPLVTLFAHRSVMGGDAHGRRGDDRGNAWLTPPDFIRHVRLAFGGRIDLDPCTEPENPTRAKRFYTVAQDGLDKRWSGNVYCNPPYSPVEPWLDKAIAEAARGARVYLLLPVRTDAAYHHRLLIAATDVLFIRGRLRFVRADGGEGKNPAFGSMLVGIGASCTPLSHLGTLLTRGVRTVRDAA